MYVCICKSITQKEYKESPEARKVCGSGCGKCLEWIELNLVPGTPYKLLEEGNEK